MFPHSTASRSAPYSAELAQRTPPDFVGDPECRDETYELLSVTEAYFFARERLVKRVPIGRRDDLGRIVHRPTPVEAMRFARVAVGGEKTLAGWRMVLGAPSGFVLVKKAA